MMDEQVRLYLRNHPKWYLMLVRYPESYYDLLLEMNQQKHETVIDKLQNISMFVQMLEMLQ